MFVDAARGALNDGDEAKAKKVSDKAWVYFKRAHLHANGLGTSALALIVLLTFLAGGDGLKGILALASGIGGLGYSVYWLLAGMRAPGMGSTAAAGLSHDELVGLLAGDAEVESLYDLLKKQSGWTAT